MSVPLYEPPAGYYDQPFSWIYNPPLSLQGLNGPNQSVRITGGYGDFLLRRIVGLSKVIPSGQIQIRDKDLGYTSSEPLFVGAKDELALPREAFYPENGAIRFDLYNVGLPAGQAVAGQIAFMGARRVKGQLARLAPAYRYKPVSYIYPTTATITGLASVNADTTIFQKITDFDFDLQQIMLIPQGAGGTAASLFLNTSFGEWGTSQMLFTAVAGGPTGNNIILQISVFPNSPGPIITVTGNTIQVQVEGQMAGFPNTTAPSLQMQ